MPELPEPSTKRIRVQLKEGEKEQVKFTLTVWHDVRLRLWDALGDQEKEMWKEAGTKLSYFLSTDRYAFANPDMIF